MNSTQTTSSFYTAELVEKLELRWGEGFLSPGGADEVALMLQGVPVRGSRVLDFGCGTGGVDVLLVTEHGAAEVVGVDIEPLVLDRAEKLAARHDVARSVAFRRVQPTTRLPFDDAAFDVVFTKDTMVHVPDKGRLFREFHRLLRAGGWLVLGDWFRSEGPCTEEMRQWATQGEETFDMASLADAAKDAARAGFHSIETLDRNRWFREYAKEEYARITGPLWDRYVARFGEEAACASAENARVRELLARQGQLRPGHLRARAGGGGVPEN